MPVAGQQPTSADATDSMGARASRNVAAGRSSGGDAAALRDMQNDPDVMLESDALAAASSPPPRTTRAPSGCPFSGGASVPLNVVGAAHQTSEATRQLLEAVGGVDTLRRVTNTFYAKMFADSHLDQFVQDHGDPHAERLAMWVAEKMGGGTPWTDERRTRRPKPVEVAGGVRVTVHDRSSAHFAAWNSKKRHPSVVGDHFSLEDARVWMRLHFWAAREAGAFDGHVGKQFEDWYVRFIAHFVRVYERAAPPFARESLRWSANPRNTKAYVDNGRVMSDVIGVSAYEAYSQLPEAERDDHTWPYGP